MNLLKQNHIKREKEYLYPPVGDCLRRLRDIARECGEFMFRMVEGEIYFLYFLYQWSVIS